jgi:cell division protein FtsN
LIAGYRPIVQKADLGAKGVWYRLRIGPMDDVGEARLLCRQLRAHGLADCLVMAR